MHTVGEGMAACRGEAPVYPAIPLPWTSTIRSYLSFHEEGNSTRTTEFSHRQSCRENLCFCPMGLCPELP